MKTMLKFKSRSYFDYAAGAPMRPSVRRLVAAIERSGFGNPGAIHAEGVRAKEAIVSARKVIADIFGVLPTEIIFTGSATESASLAIIGTVRQAVQKKKNVHVVTSTIEHPAILENMRMLEKEGVRVTYLSVDPEGLVSPRDVRDALTPDTVLVSIGYANSEIGVIQSLREIAKEIRHFRKNTQTDFPYFHTDASQAIPYEDVHIPRLGVDLFTCNSVKLGGPKSIGLLYIRSGITLTPLYFGGGQERGLRSGTESVSGICGFAEALREIARTKEKESIRMRELQSFFLRQINTQFPFVRVNGSLTSRLPNNIHISLPKIDSELAVIELDARCISVSAGSACKGAKGEVSEVLATLYGSSDSKEWGSVRFSMGYLTTVRDIKKALRALNSLARKYHLEK